MATHKCNFSERDLDRWARDTLAAWTADPDSIPGTGEAWAADRGGSSSIPGLHLRLRLRREGGTWTTDQPSVDFYLLKKIDGKKVSRLIGDRRVMGVEQARTDCKELLRKLGRGEDPREERRARQELEVLQARTYRQALESFLAEADVTVGTRRKYRASLTTTLAAVADKPLTYLTAERVRTIHRERSKESKSRADQDMRVLRLVWNHTRAQLKTENGKEVLGPNPVDVLNKRSRGPGQRGWNNVPRKQTTIPKRRLPDWFAALYAIRDDPASSEARRVSCLLLEALVLTGCRFNELATMTWSQVDTGMGTITIPDTSSKNRVPLVKPITRRVGELLEELKGSDTYVFPGRVEKQPLHNTRKLQLAIQEQIDLWITPHDLRRVWASAATRADLPMEVIKRLLNHLGHEEVTAGYIRLSMDELSDYAQTVEDRILDDAGLLPPRGLDDKLQELLAGLDEAGKRRLLAELQGAE
ncbi:MAG: tyrosine-type recombinase/integrase [Anaerolineae bacterium]